MARNRKTTSRRGRRKKAHGKSTSKFLAAIKRLKKLKSHQQSQAIHMANDAFIRQFCNRVKKLKHAKLTPKTRTKLRKYRKSLKKLLSKSTSMSSRRKMLGQRGGGFLKNLLSAIPIVGDIISGLDAI